MSAPQLGDATKLYLAQGTVSGLGGVKETSKSLMKIYLADTYLRDVSQPSGGSLPLRLLLSFHYYKNVDLDRLFDKQFDEPYPDVFADSGAFSAKTQGVEIDIRAYAEWIKRYNHLFTAYANLDVIGDAEASLVNQKWLEAQGLEPIPVFHMGSDFSALDYYLDRYSYIGLGGTAVGIRKGFSWPWLISCFKAAEGRAVYHGFGITAWNVLKSLPWYSVDSPTWASGFRYGEVPVFDYRSGRFVRLVLRDPWSCRQHGRLVRMLGFDPVALSDPARYDRAMVCAVAIKSYILAEQWLREWHGEITIPHGEEGSDRSGGRSIL